MQFNLPTTKEEMYTILNDLFYHYRVKKDGFEEVALDELVIEKMDFTPLTNQEILQKATLLVGEEIQREILDRQTELNGKILSINAKITALENNLPIEIEKLETLYENSEEKIRELVKNNGLVNSSVLSDKISYLENEKNEKIAQLTSQNASSIAELNAQKVIYEQELGGVEEYFQSLHQSRIDAQVVNLKDKQTELERTVFKYNNAIDEKEQRYKNTIKQINARLLLQYMQIKSTDFTSDQLVDMGYYTDAINCVCGYFDRLEPLTAYQQIANENKLTMYLDSHYANIVYMYGFRSGALN